MQVGPRKQEFNMNNILRIINLIQDEEIPYILDIFLLLFHQILRINPKVKGSLLILICLWNQLSHIFAMKLNVQSVSSCQLSQTTA